MTTNHGLRSAVLALTVLAALAAAPAAGAPTAPAEYTDLYAALDARLTAIEAIVASRGSGQAREVTFSAELLPANANIGEALFQGQTWPVVLLNLDRLQQLGVRGVKVAVKYPVLIPAFPRSADYLAFYRRLGDELRRRRLTFLVQMTDGFREPDVSALPVAGYYAGLTWERYRREKRQMAETIINEIRPDYLTVQNEPGTQAHNTGLPMTVERVTDLLEFVTRGLDKRGTLVGAGAGTWEDLAYVQSMAGIDALDYLDMHLYPINRDFVLDRAYRFAEVARRAGKRLVVGEAWLYKIRDQELGGVTVAAAPGNFARDVFSFWEPLDARFVSATVTFARRQQVEFASFFWSRYFFGYVEYTDATRRLPPSALFRLANMAAARGMASDPPRLTQTGETLRKLISSGK
ncbi:MAG: hypothetical protein ACRDFT_09670 [bacterium]